MSSRRICTVPDIRVVVIANGKEEVFKCGATGGEMGEPILSFDSDSTARGYVCMNCGAWIDGEETFDLCREHLGKFHELMDPFVIKKYTP